MVSASLALITLLLAAAPAADTRNYCGIYSSADRILELHRGPEGALRGYVRDGERIAALSPIDVRDGALHASATYDDGTKAELTAAVKPGPVLALEGREYRLDAVEKPADAAVRREIEEAYSRLAKAVETKNYEAFQALRVPDFATIPPNGTPSPASRMAERTRGMLERIQPPITNRNDILELTTRGDHAIATVRQFFERIQLVEGSPHTIHTEVTQRETWTRTAQGWKLLFVDEVRDPLTLDNGRRVQ